MLSGHCIQCLRRTAVRRNRIDDFRPVVFDARIAQLFYATRLRFKGAVQVELAVINGQWGVLRFIDGVLESVQSFETDGECIVRIHAQRNPDKLRHLARALKPV